MVDTSQMLVHPLATFLDYSTHDAHLQHKWNVLSGLPSDSDLT